MLIRRRRVYPHNGVDERLGTHATFAGGYSKIRHGFVMTINLNQTTTGFGFGSGLFRF
jgi:hypothetical protein